MEVFRKTDNDRVIAYKTIVNLIDVNGVATDKLIDCIENPREYYETNKDNELWDLFDDDLDDDTIIWYGLYEIFTENNIMYDLDWKVDLYDFVYFVNKLANDKSLMISEDLFDEDGEITEWAEILYERWAVLGYVLACMDIDSDSYCIFICKQYDFDKLVIEAEKIGQKIQLVQNA